MRYIHQKLYRIIIFARIYVESKTFSFDINSKIPRVDNKNSATYFSETKVIKNTF